MNWNPSKIFSLDFMQWSKCNALGLICMSYYVRNTSPFSSWTLSLRVSIFAACFHDFSALVLIRTSWSHGHAIPRKPSKSSLIRVWHKDNLYLGTNTTGNRNPHQTNIDSRTRSIRMTPWSQLFFDSQQYNLCWLVLWCLSELQLTWNFNPW
jgi:hypothetical protein